MSWNMPLVNWEVKLVQLAGTTVNKQTGSCSECTSISINSSLTVSAVTSDKISPRVHWSPEFRFGISGRHKHKQSIHKQMRAAHTHVDRGCLCSCLSVQLLPVRGGHFQPGDTANVIIQSQHRQGDSSNSFPLSVSFSVCIILSSSQQYAQCIRWPWYWKCFFLLMPFEVENLSRTFLLSHFVSPFCNFKYVQH